MYIFGSMNLVEKELTLEHLAKLTKVERFAFSNNGMFAFFLLSILFTIVSTILVANVAFAQSNNQLSVIAPTEKQLVPCQLNQSITRYPNPNCIRYIEGSTNDLENVIGNIDSIEWLVPETDDLNLGLKDQPHWFKLEGVIEPGEWVWRVNYPLIDEMEVWHFEDGKILSHYRVGDLLPFKDRPVEYPEFIFPFTVELNSTGNESNHIWLFRITNTGSMKLPIQLKKASEFWPMAITDRMIYGGFIAVFIAIILYNLVLGFMVRDSDYFIYVGYVSSFLLFALAVQAEGFQFLWPNRPHLNNILPLASTELVATFATIFFYRFVSIQNRDPRVRLLFQCLIAWGIFSVLFVTFAPYRQGLILVFTNNFTFSPAVLFFSLYWAIKGDTNARIFFIAWSLLIIGFTTVALHTVGIVPDNFLTRNASQLGAIVEVIMLSLALARKIEEARKQQYEAERRVEKKKTELKRRQIQSLEQLVVGVSHELNTPLSNAKIAGEMIIEDLNQEQKQQCSALISNNLQRMSNLINEFKNVSIHQFSYHSGLVDVKQWIESWQSRLLVDHKQLKFSKHLDSSLGQLVTEPLALILDKLVENSLQHSGLGIENLHINLDIKNTGESLEFLYSDNGVGLNTTDRDKVTDAFYTTVRGNENSTGLGMYVVANFISHFYNGHYKIYQSTEGFKFGFTLPLTSFSDVTFDK